MDKAVGIKFGPALKEEQIYISGFPWVLLDPEMRGKEAKKERLSGEKKRPRVYSQTQ